MTIAAQPARTCTAPISRGAVALWMTVVVLSAFGAARTSSAWTESTDFATASAYAGTAALSSIPQSQSPTDRRSFPAELQEDPQDDQADEFASAESSDSILSPRLVSATFHSTEVSELARAVCAVCLARAPPSA